LRAAIHERDERTRNREDSPLRQADDAVLVDTTGLEFEDVVATLMRIARERL
jgi:cytidylate kinase